MIMMSSQVSGQLVTQSCGTLNGNSDTVQFVNVINWKKIMKNKSENKSGNNQDRLFLLNPGFMDNRLQPEGQKYFCPFNAMLEGVLKYFPEVKKELEITYIDFPRPRKVIVDLLGEDNQSMPLLIIEKQNVDLSSLNVKEFQGNLFVVGSEEIVKYLSLAFHIPVPHP